MKTIVIDPAAAVLCEKLAGNTNLTVTGAYTEGIAGQEAVVAQQPDLVLLNLDLPDTSGLAILNEIAREPALVIVLSEWATFAYEAMRYGATAFLLQPFNDEDLHEALFRASRRVAEKAVLRKAALWLDALQLEQDWRLPGRVALHSKDAVDFVPVHRIIRCETAKNGCKVVLQDRRSVVLDRPLNDFERQLVYYPFLRVSRSCVVNLCHVERFQPRDKALLLHDGARVEVSAGHEEELMRRLAEV